MIQTQKGEAKTAVVAESQSSIRPGDDSDLLVQKSGRGFPLSRNPVFALEMIQTKTKDIAIWKHCRKVAIQYSPWR